MADVEEREQDTPPQEEPAGPSKVRRHFDEYGSVYAGSFVWLIVVALVTGLFTLIGVKSHTASINGRFRDRAVEARMNDIAHRTHGEISLIKPSDSSAAGYDWNSGDHTMGVQLKLGSCTFIEGSFTSPTRPKNSAALGDLIIRAPHDIGARYYPVYADVSVRDPNLYKKLEASDLAHCVAGDDRNLRYLYAPDGA